MGEAYLDMVSLLLTWPVPVHGDAMKPMLVFHSWLPRTILPWFWSPCISIDSLQERSREGQKLDMYNTLHCWRCVPKLTLDHASEVWDGTPQSQFRLIAKTCVCDSALNLGPQGQKLKKGFRSCCSNTWSRKQLLGTPGLLHSCPPSLQECQMPPGN